jgi:hypothetical protein
VVEEIRAGAPRLGASLAFGRLVELSSKEVVLFFPKEAAFHRSTVDGGARAQIEKLASTQLGRPIQMRIVDSATGGIAPLSPAEEDAQEDAQRTKQVETLVRAHPAVKTALQVLGGEIEHIEIVQDTDGMEPP